ncbi:MAG: hypothetical protein L0154_13330 [Chloroflexi bacterium]|nr:hypothetical protein [Chloroflexota bacterium]
MHKPAALLADIVTTADAVLSENALNSQQQTFVRHIRNTADDLLTIAREIPPTDHALRQIVPVLEDTFAKPQAVLFGYAQMLLEQPASFGGAVLSEWQREQMALIYDRGLALAQLTEHLKQEAAAERRAQHQAAPVIFDLNMLIYQNIPVYRYWLRDAAVKITAEFPQGLPPALCNPYHIEAFVHHTVVTMARELVAYGQIRLSGSLSTDHQFVELAIFCTGIQLTADELRILFVQNGRHIYQERVAQQGGSVAYSRENGVGATVSLRLPLPPRVTSS